MTRTTVATTFVTLGLAVSGAPVAIAAPIHHGPAHAQPAEANKDGEVPIAVRGALTMVMIAFGGAIFTVRRRDAARARKRAIGDGWQLREVKNP